MIGPASEIPDARFRAVAMGGFCRAWQAVLLLGLDAEARFGLYRRAVREASRIGRLRMSCRGKEARWHQWLEDEVTTRLAVPAAEWRRMQRRAEIVCAIGRDGQEASG